MIVEIKGMKLDVDERTAKTVEQYRVGQRVKVLTKHYSDQYRIHLGVIVGFAAFAQLPSIEVMYVSQDTFDSEPLKFVTLNEKTENVEIAPLGDEEAIILTHDDVLDRLNREINKRLIALEDMESKKALFLARFGVLFKAQEATSE